MMCYRR